MTEHTFRSPDTATAMDRVQRELGDDAYILSIQNVDGMVEIKAIKEPIYAVGGFRRNQNAKYKKSCVFYFLSKSFNHLFCLFRTLFEITFFYFINRNNQCST